MEAERRQNSSGASKGMHLHYFSKPSAGTRRYFRYYMQREAQLGYVGH